MKKEQNPMEKIIQLLEKGVKIPNPSAVEVGDEVDVGRISSKGVVLYGGTKIYGEKTLISSDTKLGYEAPVTVVNCQLASGVELKGGYFKESVFLDKANMAYGAHVREGCILEEEANGSHTVGLKQTILFPFVTLGSLINFCDCFMAGGTSRKDHSEVGSSYIHFNYTSNQDKATASLIGDVPRGVMLDQAPIFLGGQGGLVGPARIGYGTVVAAGTVCRNDCPEGGKLLCAMNHEYEKDLHPGFYGDIQRRVCNNVFYLANLLALKEWYAHIRRPFFQLHTRGAELYEGAMEKLDLAVSERVKRFEALAEKMDYSIRIAEKILSGKKRDVLIAQKREFMDTWPELKKCFTEKREVTSAVEGRDTFLQCIHQRLEEKETEYIKTIQSLDRTTSRLGTLWLQAVVDGIVAHALQIIPSCR